MSHHGLRTRTRWLRYLATTGFILFYVTCLTAHVLENVETHRSRIVASRSILIDTNGTTLIALQDENVVDHSGVVVVFSRNTEDGELGALEVHQQGYSGVDGLNFPLCGALSPNGSHLYIGGRSGGAIVIFDRDPLTGHLEYSHHIEATSSLDWVVDLAMSDDGEVVYAVSKSAESITVFARDPATGSLTQVQEFSTHPVSFAYPVTIELSPDGAHLYVGAGPKLGVLDIDNVSGTLTHLNTTDAPIDPSSLALSPDGNHLYAGSRNDDAVAVYSRNPADGLLTFVEVLEHGNGGINSLRVVSSVNLTPDGSQVIVSAEIHDSVTIFDRDPGTGQLTVSAVFKNGVAGVRGLDGALSIAVSADGQDVYALGIRDRAIAHFDRDPVTGFMTLSGVAYDRLGGLPSHLGASVIDKFGSDVSPDGAFVYTLTGTNNGGVLILRRSGSDGRLTYRGRELDQLDDPITIGVSPDGDHLLVAEDHRLTVFDRDHQTGLLEFVEQHVDGVAGAQGLLDPRSIAFSPNGESVYVSSSNLATGGSLAVFSRNPTTGALVFVEAEFDDAGGVNGLNGAQKVIVSPDGANLYAAGSRDDAVAVFDRDPSTGQLTFVEAKVHGVDGVVGLRDCESVALSPDGASLYAAGRFSDSVVNFTRDPTTGMLSYEGKKTNGFGGVEGLDGPRSILVTPDGNWVVAASTDDDALAVFARNPTTGTLRFAEHHSEIFPDFDDRFGPEHITSSADGRSIYTTGNWWANSGLAVFRMGGEIDDGVPLQNPGIIGWRTHRIEVPVCADRVDFEVLDLNRNGDLYTRFGAMPSATDHDCLSANPGTDSEICTHVSPTAGTWWVAVAPPPTGNPLRFTLLATIGGCADQDLVSWWPAENDPMDIVGGNHGIPEGGLGYGQGMVGSAFALDGIDDALLVPHDPSLDVGSGDATISLWVKTDTDDDDVSLLDWRGVGPLHGLHVYLYDGRPAVHLGDGSAFSSLVADRGVADGRFHHLAVSLQRNTINGGRLLIDGRDTHTFDLAPVSGVLDSTEDLTMGRSTDATGGAAHFTGSIDEIRFHHRALPLREAVDSLGSLMGWWPGDGNTFDRGGTNHAVGDPSYTQGRWAQAFRFTASSDPVMIPYDPSLGVGAGDLAVGCWIWSTTETGQQTILDTRDAGGVGYRFYLDAGRPAIELDDGSQTAGVVSDTVIADGQLHHLVISVDRDANDGGTVFIDTTLDSAFDPTGTGGDLDTLEDLAIGRDTAANGGQSPFIGGVDDLQLHGAPMTQTQVEWSYGSDGLLFLDGFETGNTSRWTLTTP